MKTANIIQILPKSLDSQPGNELNDDDDDDAQICRARPK